jgi:superfamily I DNA/RNA helicase
MYRVVPNDWRPVEVDSLEPSADRVVRSTRNALVLAGPGAGKTELLAQRACYLLQTGICPYPRRILAISFKRDAAKNLRERVEARCGEDATRFESLTLDAFAKGLVDRFVDSLLPDWRPGAGYEVMTALLPAADIRDWLAQAGIPRKHIEGLSDGAIRRRFDHLCHGIALPFDGESVKPRHRELGLRWWRQQLGISRGKPSLTFPMLNRLAAFLLRTNPKVIAALRETFSFVFMDEFQDTTSAQYDLVQVGFRGTDSVLTAVGDSKQRIMLWAGAMIDVFDVYANDFAAVRHHLSRNYRSAPKLIAMQNTIALTLETGTPEAEPADDGLSGSCSIIEFSTPEDEATYVAELIEDGLKNRGLGPRDFGILARQRTSKMIEPLKAELARRAIRLRDESLLQDLLTEPIVSFLLSVLRLGTRKRDPEAWDVLTTELATLMGSNPEAGHDLIQQHACSLVDHVRSELLSGRPVHSIPGDLTAFVGLGSPQEVQR